MQKAVFRIIPPDLTRRSAPKDDRSRTSTRLREAGDVLRTILWFWHFHFKLLGFDSLVYIFSYVGKMIDHPEESGGELSALSSCEELCQ